MLCALWQVSLCCAASDAKHSCQASAAKMLAKNRFPESGLCLLLVGYAFKDEVALVEVAHKVQVVLCFSCTV